MVCIYKLFNSGTTYYQLCRSTFWRMFSLCNFCESFLPVIVWSSHKWTRTGSGTSVIWSWSNQTESGTRYTPALLFANLLVLKMLLTCTHCSTAQDIHPILAVTTSTFIFVADVKCRLYEINKYNTAGCYTWTESGPKNVPRPKWSDVGPERSRTGT